ncbi:MAG: hypothetical protein U0350_24110 [Caldilineaceae bacterium]
MNAMHKHISEATARPSLAAKAFRTLLALTVALAMLTILPEAKHIGEEIPQWIQPSGAELAGGLSGGVVF